MSPRLSVVAQRLTGAVLEATRPDEVYYAASVIKLPLLFACYRAADRGEIALTDPLEVTTSFRSVHDARPYTLDPDDVDAELAARAGGTATVAELAERMVVVSSNEATNLLLARLGGPVVVTGVARALGAPSVQMQRGIGDHAAAASGRANTITAAGVTSLLLALGCDRAARAASCARMRGVLERQQLRDGIAAALPPGVVVASKSGWVTGILHDAAIVSGADCGVYAVTILTEGFATEEAARAGLHEAARRVHALARAEAAATGGSRSSAASP